MNSVYVDFKNINGPEAPDGMVDIWNCPKCGTQVAFGGDKPQHTGTGTVPANCGSAYK